MTTDTSRSTSNRAGSAGSTAVEHFTVRPGDDDYQAATTTFVGRGDAAAVLRPTTTAEVAAAVTWAVAEGLDLAVRSGGHHALNSGNSDGGAVIDLSRLAEVEVLDGGRVRIGAGATWGDVADALRPHGLAISSGDTRSVGVGGLTLGGGMGWLVRSHGLTIDNLLAAEIVTAAGETVRASAEENADLFWALRGGGGNVGVVTWFEFRAAPVARVRSGFVGYPADEAEQVLGRYVDVMQEAPDTLTSALIMIPDLGGPMPAGVMVFVCDTGDDPSVLDPLHGLGTVTMAAVEEKDYADVLEEAHPPPGVRGVVDNTLVREVSPEVVAAVVGAYRGGRVVFVRWLGGQFSRVDRDATAFAHRDVEAMVVSAAFVPHDADAQAVARAREGWSALAELGVGSYAGFVDRDGEDVIEALYPAATRARLAEVARRWDPDRVFRHHLAV